MPRSKICSIVLLVLLTGSTTRPSTNDQPASKFYFPHFVSGNGNETTFIISNSSAQDASIQITAYGDEGNLLQLRPNQAGLRLTAQSQIQIRAGDLLDIPDGGMIT